VKSTIFLAAALALGCGVAVAAETQAQAPTQMTAAEMDKVVAGAIQSRLQLKDGTGVNHTASTPNLYLGSKGKGDGTGICKQ
jgi:hypothetical protein